MKFYNNSFEISTAHFVGNQEMAQNYFYNLFKNQKIIKSDNLALLLIANKECLEKAQLVKQLNYNNIDYYCNEEAYNTRPENWNNTKKLLWVAQTLEKIKEKYTLILDVRDIILTGDLDDRIIEGLNYYNCKALYNASENNYPNTIYNKTDIASKYEFKYLNGGVCIGETDFLKSIYYEANEIQEKCKEKNKSEQFILRQVYNKNKLINIDYERRYFAKISSFRKDSFEIKNNDLFLAPAEVKDIENPIIITTKNKPTLPDVNIHFFSEKNIDEASKELINFCNKYCQESNSLKLRFFNVTNFGNYDFLKILPNKKHELIYKIDYEKIDFLFSEEFKKLINSFYVGNTAIYISLNEEIDISKIEEVLEAYGNIAKFLFFAKNDNKDLEYLRSKGVKIQFPKKKGYHYFNKDFKSSKSDFLNKEEILKNNFKCLYRNFMITYRDSAIIPWEVSCENMKELRPVNDEVFCSECQMMDEHCCYYLKKIDQNKN